MTTANLNFPMGDIRASFNGVHLTPGTANHRLVIQTAVVATWLDQRAPTLGSVALMVGSVWADQPFFRWVAGLEPQTLTLRPYSVDEELVLSLSDEQLIALDHARGEGDVLLRLKLQATLLDPPDGVHPIATQEISYCIPRARWLDILDQVGAEVGILVRVKSPLTDSPSEQPPPASAEDAASLAQATDRLRQARAELRDHQWEHCVATCRRVLENVGRLVPLPPVSQIPKVPADRSQDERWAAIFYDVKSMASAAHHDDERTAGFVWGRADAEPLLAATAGLLAHYTSD